MEVVFVVGPTATGKSELAKKIAFESEGEIVNCDSVQVYKELNIGSAKPSQEERKERPHHLYDFVPLTENFTAGDYARKAIEVLQEAETRKVPKMIFVGGSGFYIQALLTGMYEVEKPSEDLKEKTLAQIEKMGWEWAFDQIKEKDAAYAEKIHVNDHYRIQRALEVILGQGQKMSELQARSKEKGESFPYEYQMIGLECEREELRKRLEVRTDKMLEEGFITEVKDLVEKGYAEASPMMSVGYKEVQDHLNGAISREELAPAIVQASMKLAKKQMTWFRRVKEVEWRKVEPN